MQNDRQYDYDMAFLGGLFPESVQAEVLRNSRGAVQFAANTFQWHLIHGLDANLATPAHIVNLMFVGSFPMRYRKLFVPGFEFSHTPGAVDCNVGYFNLSMVKFLLLGFPLHRALVRWARQESGRPKVLFIYSLLPVFLTMAKKIKTRFPSIHICITVNDLPQYMNMGRHNMLYTLLRHYSCRCVARNLKYVDSVIPVTEAMMAALPVGGHPHVVVEGAVDPTDAAAAATEPGVEPGTEKIIFYAGTLTAKYGILTLVEAFSNLRGQEYRLVICGQGETADAIRSAAQADPRILFRGNLPRAEVIRLERQATVLVNPRPNDEEFTKYSFPYKMMEYLLSGTPVVCYRLDGFPREYDDLFCYVTGAGSESLRRTLESICTLPAAERARIGQRNRDFMLKNKNYTIQGERILAMIEQQFNKANGRTE